MSFRNPTFAYQLLEAIIVDPRGCIRGEPNIADEVQPFDQLADVVRLRRTRRIAKPRESACLQRRIEDQQLIKLGDLDFRDAGQQRISGALARTGSAGHRRAFDHCRRGQDHLLGTQRRDYASSDRMAAIGAPCRLRGGFDHERQVGRACWPQPKRRGQDARMIGHRLRSAGILRECCDRNVEVLCQPSDK